MSHYLQSLPLLRGMEAHKERRMTQEALTGQSNSFPSCFIIFLARHHWMGRGGRAAEQATRTIKEDKLASHPPTLSLRLRLLLRICKQPRSLLLFQRKNFCNLHRSFPRSLSFIIVMNMSRSHYGNTPGGGQ